ncbi:MAG: BrnA antitoxin family protein [Terracidiphilus sp.]
MSTEDIRNRKWTETEKQVLRRAAAERPAGLDLPEKEYKDIPRLTPEQLARMVRLRGPRRKVAVSVRLDPLVLDWLKSKGEGHLTRINDILTNLMEMDRRTGSKG